MKEELQIKVKVDTSSITTTLNKLKNEVSNVEKTMNGTASSSSSITTSTNKSVQAQTKLTQKLTQMVDKLKTARGMGFADWAVAILGMNKGLEVTSKKLKEISSSAFITDQGKMFQGVFSKIQGLGIQTDDTGMAKGGGIVSDAFKDLQNGILNAKNQKALSNLVPTMKELGINTEALGLSGKTAGAGLKGMTASMTAAGAAATAAAAAVGVLVAAIAALVIGVATAFKVSKLGDEIYHTAHRFNMSTEAFQEWSWVMERSGGSIDDLTGFMETLASEQAAVIEGSEGAIENFKRLGLSADEVVGMRQQELFETTVARIQQIGDETERAAIAYTIFGDEASKFMNVLNMSNAEMEEQIKNYHLLGGSMSGELLEKSNKLQNSVAGMKQAWQGISNTIAEVFIPVAQKVVEWLTKAFVWVNLFFKTIFGLDLQAATGDAMDSAASSTNKYASATKGATKAAEELKRVTMGFDELNIVSDPNKGSADSSGSSSPALGGGMGDMSSLMPDMSSLNLDKIYEWFEKYKGIIAQITTWSLLLIGIILAVIGCMTVNIPMAMIGFGMAGLGIAIGIKSGAFAEAWEAVKKVAIKAGEWIAGIPGWFWEDILVPIGNFFVDMGNAIAETAKKVWDSIVNFITSIPGWISDNIIQPILNFFKGLWDGIKQGAKNAWEGIKNTFKTIGNWINTNIVQPVGNFFSNMWSGFKSGASKAWEGIKSVFGNITTWFKDKFTQAWTAVKNVFSTGGKIFDGIKDGIANVFKTVVNGLIGGINKVIKVPFDAINGMLNKIRDVNILGVEPFKSFWKHNPLSVPQIPKLAKGGIATSSTLANIGEAGKEAVLPLENNTEWMDLLADRIAARNSAPSKIVLQVGEKELGWATINGINNITKQTGNIQLVL